MLRGAAAAGGAALLNAPFHTAQAQTDDKTLTWLTYPGHGAPEVVAPFEEKYGVKIVAKEYSGGERLLALIHGSPAGTFDVVLSDEAYVNELKQADFIEPMNPADYPIADFWPCRRASFLSASAATIPSPIRSCALWVATGLSA